MDENFTDEEEIKIKNENQLYDNDNSNLSNTQSIVFSVHSNIHDNIISYNYDELIYFSFEETI